MKYDRPEKIRLAKDVNAMRKELLRMQRYDGLVRSVMDLADYQGLSAEDRYVILAYSALRERERLTEVVLEDLMTRPPVHIVPKKAMNEEST